MSHRDLAVGVGLTEEPIRHRVTKLQVLLRLRQQKSIQYETTGPSLASGNPETLRFKIARQQLKAIFYLRSAFDLSVASKAKGHCNSEFAIWKCSNSPLLAIAFRDSWVIFSCDLRFYIFHKLRNSQFENAAIFDCDVCGC